MTMQIQTVLSSLPMVQLLLRFGFKVASSCVQTPEQQLEIGLPVRL